MDSESREKRNKLIGNVLQGGFLLFALGIFMVSPLVLNTVNKGWNAVFDPYLTEPGPDGRSPCDDVWKLTTGKGGGSTWGACQRLAERNGTLEQHQAQVAKRATCLKPENVKTAECAGIRP